MPVGAALPVNADEQRVTAGETAQAFNQPADLPPGDLGTHQITTAETPTH